MRCFGEGLEPGMSVNAGLCPAPPRRTLLVHLSSSLLSLGYAAL